MTNLHMPLLWLFLFVGAAIWVTESKVTQLTTANFADKTKDGIWMVKFFAPWCGHCNRMAPVWEEYAKLAEGVYNVAEVDCTAEKAVGDANGIRGFPTIRLFADGVGQDVSVPRTVKHWVEFVETHVKSPEDIKGKIVPPEVPEVVMQPKKPTDATPRPPGDVVVLTADNFDEKTKSGAWFVKFYAPWCGHCKTLAPVWEELATLQKEEQLYFVGEVDATVETALAQRYEIRGYPTMLLFIDGHPPLKYAGLRTVLDLNRWVKQRTPPKTEL